MKQKLLLILTVLFTTVFINASATKTVTDSTGRMVEIPVKINRIICSGAGCLRLITYMNAQDLVIGVDDIEKRDNISDARSYAIANPRYKNLPLIGEFRGNDNPELILNLNPAPDVIFKVYSTSGHDAVELEDKTGIPVIILKYGDLSYNKSDLFGSLRLIGNVLGKTKRAEEIISFIDRTFDDLDRRTKDISDSRKKTCFIGGVAQAGSHGFNSTEPAYSPFKMINALNTAFDKSKTPKELAHAYISKEKIIEWDPDVLFIDLSTLQTTEEGNALYELANDPVYSELDAVKKGEVYGLLPYNWYSTNFDSVIANAYYAGKVLFPDRFKDVDPQKKADEIFRFFAGEPVFDKLDRTFGGKVFKKIKVK